MIVLAQDYDTLDRGDAAKAGLEWPMRFGTKPLCLKRFAEPEREIIDGLLCIPAQIPTGQQLFAVVSVVNLFANRFVENDRTWPTFAGKMVPRSTDDLAIDHYLVQVHYVRTDGTSTLFGRPIDLQKLAKQLPDEPASGSYRNAIQKAVRDLVDAAFQENESEIEELSSRLELLKASSVNLGAMQAAVHAPSP